MKITKLLLRICKVIFIGVLGAVLLLNIANVFKRVFLKEEIPLVLGYGSAVIITGSMEPTISPGDIVVIHKQQSFAVGDIVAYRSDKPITHRIVEKTRNGYITQGDANSADDGEIEYSRMIGKVVKVIPKIGNIILFFQSPLGMLILIIGLFILIEAPIWFKKIRKERRAGST